MPGRNKTPTIGLAAAGLLLQLLLSQTVLAAENVDPISVTSPNGQLSICLELADQDERSGCPTYRVLLDDQVLITPSGLGLKLADGTEWIDAYERIQLVKRDRNDTTWKTVCGERAVVRDHYQAAVVDLIPKDKSRGPLRLEIRAYDQGIAFRYSIPVGPNAKKIEIAAERTQFHFPADHDAWAVYSAQGVYRKSKLSEIRNGCERPLTIRTGDGTYIALAEAALVDHARMKLGPSADAQSGDAPFGVVSQLHGPVTADLPLHTPWRVIMVADSPGKLLENNDILRNLNAPCAIEDTSWIRPGKVLREVSLTTEGGKRCVDFAVKYGLQFVEYDAGWYGPEGDEASDATTVTLDSGRSKGPLDLHEVIRYAKQRDIGIIVYVNRRAVERQLHEILPLYRRWGISGIKYGFVNVGSQQWTSWLHMAIREAAKNQLMIDVHDEYRPTGWERTYPNFMTAEGIGGDETAPSNEQTLTILFTRMIAGPGDNTVCYYDGRVDRNASHAYQLAKPVCLFSPWQFLFWYDRPATAQDEPELEFFKHMPTIWDDTKVLDGQIGQYALIARRHGREWFIGCMNAGSPRTFDIRLDFLRPGETYTAHIYRDDPTVNTRTKVGIERRSVTSKTVLQESVTAQGGVAIRLVSAK